MNTKTLYLLACPLSLYVIAGTSLAASLDAKKPKATTADVPSVNAPVPTLQSSQPKVKLNGDTMNAISEPLAPTSKPPQKTVKPAQVPKSITEPQTPSASTKPGAPPVSTPDIPKAPATAAIQKPQLDNRQLQQIRQLQESAAAAAALGRVEQIRPGEQAGGLPDQEVVDPATGTALQGKGIGSEDIGERLRKADELVHDLMYGRAGTFSEDPSDYIGADTERGPKLNSGPGTGAAAVGAENLGTSAASETTVIKDPELGIITITVTTTPNSNGVGFTTTRTVHAESGSIVDTTITGANKRVEASSHVLYDAEGNEVESETTDVTYDKQGIGHAQVVVEPSSDRLPSETASNSQQGDCSPTSNWGCKKGRDNPMDMVTQPVHGDEVANLTGPGSSHPNAGPDAVTNPGEGSSNGGGGGSRSGGRDGAVDPEEIIPGPLPAPGGGNAATGATGSAASIDEALGGLEGPGVD